jgi:hypothetical protein
MNNNDNFELVLESAEWTENKIKKMLKKYKGYKTASARKKLAPKLNALKNKLAFEKRIIDSVL